MRPLIWIRAAVALAVLALCGLPLPPAAADQRVPFVRLSRDLLFSRGVVQRHLRGDYEPPDVLVLAYDSDWEPALRQILDEVQGRVQVALAPVREDAHRRSFRAMAKRPGVVVVDSVLDTSWVRDFAPLQLRDAAGLVYWYDFPYSDDRPEDDAFPQHIAARWRARYERAWFPMDGGGIISNGRGLCAMTDETLRQTTLRAESHTDAMVLLGELGCEALVRVPPLPNEDTGHVDMIAQFVSPSSLVVGSVDAAVHPEVAAALDEAAARLARAGRRLGLPLAITRVPYEVKGTGHLTYVNGTALEGAFLVPRYARASPAIERRALDALQRAMPGRKLVKIDADAIIDRGGSVHCITAGLNLEGGRGTPPALLLELESWLTDR